jgi:hypothetical protein
VIYGKIRYGFLFSVLFAVMAVSALNSFPDYISYYNYFAGGSEKGYKIATDSNYDWGQDVTRLAKWTTDNNIETIYVVSDFVTPLHYYIGNHYQKYDIDKQELPPRGSYVAFSINEYQNFIYRDTTRILEKNIFAVNNIIARVGKTILIFQIP